MSASASPRSPRLSAPVKVLLALALAAVIGLSLSAHDPALALRVAEVFRPIGKLWLNALQMTVVPLVTALVIMGVNNASTAAASGRAARNALIVFALLLVAAASFSAAVTPALLDLIPTGDGAIVQDFRTAMGSSQADAVAPTATQFLGSLIPSNALAAAASSVML